LNLEELKQIAEAEQAAAAPLEHTVRVCVAASCLSSRSDQVKAALESEVKAHGLEHKCKVTGVGCMGLCAAGPLVEVHSGQQTIYQAVVPEDSFEIVESLGKGPVERLVLPTTQPFFSGQKKPVVTKRW
jgi:bidirectional [NiFe] hydrogenase diaphorase subunit